MIFIVNLLRKNWQAVKQKTLGGKKKKKVFIRQQHRAGLLLSADVFWHQWTAEAPQSAELTSIHTIASPQVWTWRTITFTAYAHSGSDIYYSTCCDMSCGASSPPPSRPASDPCWPGGSTADVAELQRVEKLSRLYCGFHCAADTSTEEVLFLCQQESPNIFRDKPNSQSKKLFSCRSLWNGAFPSSSLPSELHRVFSHVEKDSNTYGAEKSCWKGTMMMNNSSSLCQHVTGLPIWHRTQTMELDCK